jgi:hypothetical protein
MRGDIFDSREVIERIEELESAITFDEDGGGIPAPDTAPDLLDELRILREIRDECEDDVSDWQYGEAFIPDADFEDYARDLAEDIGAIDRSASWPMTYIDWRSAADALKQDYTPYQLDGVDYWARA